jgi:CheY-like chemotaxis protein
MTIQDTRVLLLVEDNPDDVFLMRRALKKTGLALPIHIVTDGRQAVEYLSGASNYQDRSRYPLPSLVFLDLKLPYLNGFEVLKWIREDETLNALDVFILTSSPEERDKQTASELGAKAYLVKPPTSDVLINALASQQNQDFAAILSH